MKNNNWRPPTLGHRWGTGWILGTLSGEPAFSDGCALFIGARKGSPHPKPECFENARKELQLKNSPRLTLGKEMVRESMRLRFIGPIVVQKIYCDYALTFPGVKFYAGKKKQSVICKVGSKVVGIIMAVRV